MTYILSIDAGTTSIRSMAFGHDGQVLAVSQRPLRQMYPAPGWVEHDPTEIRDLVLETVKDIAGRLDDPCAAVAVTNQRETAVLWDRITGKPLYNAIVWQDRRTSGICDSLIKKGLESEIFLKTGLHIDPYFTGTKIKWIIDNIPTVKEYIAIGRAMAGTVDSWIIWNLTGGKTHKTDHSNAARTMLFDIRSLEWDEKLLDILEIPKQILPKAVPTRHMFGMTDKTAIGIEVPIACSMGDQQAALFGQCCLDDGDVKVTFGTGGFLLMNLGDKAVSSDNGLLTTVAWTSEDRRCYALEGSVYIAGAAIQWLRDELQIVEESSETERMASSVEDTAGCVIVPAFTGLGAPHWDQGARGTIMGLTRGTNRNHLARAALESIAFQAYDVICAMDRKVNAIKVDGGASANNFLCQFLADISGIRVLRPKVIESTALGAAYGAGLEVGFWKQDDLRSMWTLDREFLPTMSEQDRARRLECWKKAVECAKSWSSICGDNRFSDTNRIGRH